MRLSPIAIAPPCRRDRASPRRHCASHAPAFVQPNNLADLFNDTSILFMMALAQMTVILTKCIDLSVAANIALTGVLVALLNAAHPDGPCRS